MNILILNGSPRKNGNTRALLETLGQSIQGHQWELVDVPALRIGGCLGCDACQRSGGVCVQKDDASALLERLLAADCVIFGTPVYWWGISAQLKAAIDRLYAGGSRLAGKQIGVVAVGAEAVEGTQYRLIREQFQCMAEYLHWDLRFFEAVSASEAGAVRKDEALMERFAALGAGL